MSYAYAVTNLCTPLAAGAFFANGSPSPFANGAFLNDGRMDKRATDPDAPELLEFDLVVDFGSAKSVSGFALLNNNCALDSAGSAVTVSVDAADNSAFSTNHVTAKAASTLYAGADARDPRRKDHVLQFPAVSRRWWRLIFLYANELTPAIGELFAFSASVPLSRSDIYGSGEREEAINAHFEAYNGNTFAYALGGPLRSKMLVLADWTQAQLAELQVLWRTTRGAATPFLWLNSVESTSTAATAAAQDCIYGRLTGIDQLSWVQDDYGIFQPPPAQVRSLGREIGA